MKRSNFIQPITVSSIQEVRFWYWIYCVASSVVIITIAISSYTQWYFYCSLTTTTAALRQQLQESIATITEQQTKLEEQQQLQKKLAAIQRYKKNPKNPLSILKTIRNVTREMTLENISITRQQFVLNAFCSSIAHVTACLTKCTQNPLFAHVQLTSLQTQHDTVQITITGTIVGALQEINT